MCHSRCLRGALNGNSGLIKSMVAEISDSTNIARTFSFIPITWFLGASIGFVYSLLGRYPVLSDVAKATYWWVVRAACGEIPCDIWELHLSQGIPLLPAMFHICRYRGRLLARLCAIL